MEKRRNRKELTFETSYMFHIHLTKLTGNPAYIGSASKLMNELNPEYHTMLMEDLTSKDLRLVAVCNRIAKRRNEK